MKKLYFTLAVLCISLFSHAQCFVQVQCNGVTCFGNCDGSATAYANGVPPFSFTWMPGGQTTQTITGLCPGTYTVVVTDSLGCNATSQCTVMQPQPLQAMFTNVVNPTCPTCCDGSFTGTATGGNPPYTYTLWPPTGPPYPFPSLNNACNGQYVLCVTDANGCVSCDTITLSFSTSLTSAAQQTQMTIVPSHSAGEFQLNVTFPEVQSGEVVVTNALGQTVSRTRFSATGSLQSVIDLSGESTGIYFVSVVTDRGTFTKRVIR